MFAVDFLSFTVGDASGDDSSLTTLESSALEVDYFINTNGQTLVGVDILARQGNQTLKLGERSSFLGSDVLVSLDGFANLTGSWEIFASARTANGMVTESASVNVQVLPTTTVTGGFRAETFDYTASHGTAAVYSGSGGTDTLSLDVLASSVATFNGAPLSALAPNSLVTSQAIYAGTAFDYLRLTDGSEVYLQGIERLEFADGSVTELQTRPNDPRFNAQWNLAIADVPDAWRFTRGSEDVLVVSLDNGIPISNGNATFSDLESDRLIFRGAADGFSNRAPGHGHQATSIFAAEANNNEGIAGINWESPVLVLDLYGGDNGNIGINTAIQTALNELNNLPASRIVFQGGIQGEFWLNVLNQGVLPGIEDNTLFAIAAGNGGRDIADTTPNDGLTGGVARLEGVYDNFIAVGSLIAQLETSTGQSNANFAFLSRFSNFGENLTLVAPSGVPSQLPDGSDGIFTGTSAANPGVAGYSSLIWSINPELTGGEVRQILTETATDLGVAGRDTIFGHGVPNAGAAVRRAWALNADGDLANLGVNPLSTGPELPGDFNLDGVVNTADYAVWRDARGTGSVQFTGADASGDGFVDRADYDIWFANAGARFATVPLIGATLGNGEFAVDDPSDISPLGGAANPTQNLARDRALLGSQVGGQGISIDGWDITRINYPVSNNAFGFDGLYGFATDAGTGPGQTGQAFVNSGVVEVRSDPVSDVFQAGETLELSYLLGSDNALGNPEATTRLIFDEGLPTQFTHTFDTVSASGLTTPAITHEYELPAAASSVTVAFTLDGVTSGRRALLDRVELDVTRIVGLSSSSAVAGIAAPTASALAGMASPDFETGFPADNFPDPIATSEPAAPVVVFAPTLSTAPSSPTATQPAAAPQVNDEALLLLAIDSGSAAETEEQPAFGIEASDSEPSEADLEDALLALV